VIPFWHSSWIMRRIEYNGVFIGDMEKIYRIKYNADKKIRYGKDKVAGQSSTHRRLSMSQNPGNASACRTRVIFKVWLVALVVIGLIAFTQAAYADLIMKFDQ
jgi:hypothetical protein